MLASPDRAPTLSTRAAASSQSRRAATPRTASSSASRGFMFSFVSGFSATIPSDSSALSGQTAIRRTGHALIELGCGPGFYSCQFAARFPQISVLGVDRSARQLDCALTKARSLGLLNCRFSSDNVLDLSHADDTFDVVIAARLFTVLPNPKQRDRRDASRAAARRPLPHRRTALRVLGVVATLRDVGPRRRHTDEQRLPRAEQSDASCAPTHSRNSSPRSHGGRWRRGRTGVTNTRSAKRVDALRVRTHRARLMNAVHRVLDPAAGRASCARSLRARRDDKSAARRAE